MVGACESAGYVLLLALLLRLLYAAARFLHEYVVGRGVDLSKMGEWAVVTGATDGIGKEYAIELSRRGLKVLLVGRSEEKLEATKAAVESAGGGACEVRTLKADFTHTTGLYEMIGRELDTLQIGVLVNNVGVSYQYPDLLMSLENVDRLTTDMLNVNALSALRMCQLVLGQMMSRGKGVILNVSSAAALKPLPMWTAYCASKAYVKMLSECLYYEYASKGIIIQCVIPFYVCSKMSGLRRPSLMTPSARDYARSSLSVAGVGGSCTHGYWAHHLQGALTSLLPDAVYAALARRMSEGIKRATLRKLAKRQ